MSSGIGLDFEPISIGISPAPCWHVGGESGSMPKSEEI